MRQSRREYSKRLHRLAGLALGGIALFCAWSSEFSAAQAAQIVPAEREPGAETADPSKPLRGLAALKAQMNALHGGLDNLRRLRVYFDDAEFNDDAVLLQAKQLIATLPQHENAGDAAWRIAAVASLTLSSGAIADVDVDNAYRLAPGAVGWDLGPEGAQVHAGFTPVTPKSLERSGAATAVLGPTALTDGIAAPGAFNASLPNGLYRILIVRDDADDGDPPFGDEITVNGSPIRGQVDSERGRLKLTGDGDTVASNGVTEPQRTAPGLGIEGWAIVEHGKLNVDFSGVPESLAITAIIAEPFEIEQLDLNPTVMESLAESLGDVAPAAGPKTRQPRRGPSFAGSARPQGQPSGNTGGSTPPPPPSSKASGNGGGSPSARTSFASTRGFPTTTDSTTETDTAQTGAPQDTPEDQPETTDDDTPAFEERQVLLKRSLSDGPDSEGVAIDLGALLDDASLSGVFMCLAEPCEDVAPIAPEPDLAAAAEALGEWLSDPENLPDGWEELERVLAERAIGSEVAIVYEFEIGTDSWTDVELRASAGGGLFVWLDGTYIFGASESGDFVDGPDFEYRLELPDLPGGKHYLQILSESHIAGHGFGFELRGTPVANSELVATSVPEPGTVLLFAAGLGGLLVMRRRKTETAPVPRPAR